MEWRQVEWDGNYTKYMYLKVRHVGEGGVRFCTDKTTPPSITVRGGARGLSLGGSRGNVFAKLPQRDCRTRGREGEGGGGRQGCQKNTCHIHNT